MLQIGIFSFFTKKGLRFLWAVHSQCWRGAMSPPRSSEDFVLYTQHRRVDPLQVKLQLAPVQSVCPAGLIPRKMCGVVCWQLILTGVKCFACRPEGVCQLKAFGYYSLSQHGIFCAQGIYFIFQSFLYFLITIVIFSNCHRVKDFKLLKRYSELHKTTSG